MLSEATLNALSADIFLRRKRPLHKFLIGNDVRILSGCFLKHSKAFRASPTRALAKCAWYHEEFAFLQVRWPNGHQNTYRHGAEGACDLLIHPAVSLLICPSIHPFVRSLVRIFRSCHPYVRLIRSFPGFSYSKGLEVSSFSLPSPSSCLYTVNCLLSARGGGGRGLTVLATVSTLFFRWYIC